MNNPQDPIIVGVHRCVREAFHIAGAITPDMKFVDDMGADSLDKTEFVLALEDEFRIDIPDYAEFGTVQEAVDYIRETVGAGAEDGDPYDWRRDGARDDRDIHGVDSE